MALGQVVARNLTVEYHKNEWMNCIVCLGTFLDTKDTRKYFVLYVKKVLLFELHITCGILAYSNRFMINDVGSTWENGNCNSQSTTIFLLQITVSCTQQGRQREPYVDKTSAQKHCIPHFPPLLLHVDSQNWTPITCAKSSLVLYI